VFPKERAFSNKVILSFVLLQLLWVALLAVSVLFPLAAILTIIPIIALTTLFHIKNCRVNLIVLIATKITASIVSNGDVIVVLFAFVTVFSTLGMLWGLKWRSYKVGAGISALLVIVLTLTTILIYTLIVGESPYEFAWNYVEYSLVSEGVVFVPHSQIRLVARFYYAINHGAPAAIFNYELYNTRAVEVFQARVVEWSETTIFYHIMSAATFIGIFTYLLIKLGYVKTKNLKFTSNWAFTVVTEPVKFKDMRLDRKFFLYFFLPSLAIMLTGFIASLSGNGGLESTMAAIVNVVITIPTGFASFALLVHSLDRIKLKRIKVPFFVILGILFVWAMLNSTVMLVVSFLGLADSLINVRKLLDYAFAPIPKEELEKRKKEIEKKVEEEKQKRAKEKEYDVFKKIERVDDPLKIDNLETIIMEDEEDNESNFDE